MTADLAPGALIAGRYRLDRLLGRGGMGQVWAVTHEVTHRAAALKLLNGPIHLQADRRRRFLREARAASAVNHPNVVGVHDFFELEDGTPVMLMDLLEGETLKQRLVREGTLSLAQAVEILLPVVSAVGTAHALGIVHRDLKPDNVFLARTEQGTLDVRVLDFGVAKLVRAAGEDDSDALTGAGGVLGTPSYMSPEQGFGDASVDHRSDIWSLGVLLYEMLSGSRPVDGANVGQILARLMNEAITPIEVLVPELPADIAGLVGAMLRRDPAERPQDLRQVQAVLSLHGSLAVPEFGPAVGEAPLAIDSGPMSGPRSVQTVIQVTAESDPGGRTLVASPPEASTTGAGARPQTPSRLYLVAFLLAAAAVVFFWWRPPDRAAPPPVEPSSVPGATTPAGEGAEPERREPPAAPPRPPAPVESSVPREQASGPAGRPRPAAPQVKTPAPSPSRRGLVDEPPF